MATVGFRVCVTPLTTVVSTGKGKKVVLLDVVLLAVVLKDDTEVAEDDVVLSVPLLVERNEVLSENATDVAENAVVRRMEVLFDVVTGAVKVLGSKVVLLLDSVVDSATEGVVEVVEVLVSEVEELFEVLCAVDEGTKLLEVLFVVTCTTEENVVLLVEALVMVVLVYWAVAPLKNKGKLQVSKPTTTTRSAI